MRIIALATALSFAVTSIAQAQTAASTPPGVATPTATAGTGALVAPSPAPGAQQAVVAPTAVNLAQLPPIAGGGGLGGFITTTDGVQVPVFGTELFSGAFAGTRPGDRPDYRIQPGDQISISLYGALTAAAVQPVDSAGNVFVPAVGPVAVGGIAASQLQSTLEARVHTFYTSAVGVYASIVQAGSIGVFVAGNVRRPGRFLGGSHDSVIYFLSQAGGIDPARGSFRNISVTRGGSVIATYDLYDFLINGRAQQMNFRDGDTIVVSPRSSMIGVTGAARSANAFESPSGAKTMTGAELVGLARPEASVTSVALRGFRNGQPQSAYFTLQDFNRVVLGDGDHVEFRSDAFVQNVTVKISGEVRGPTVYVLPRGSTLSQLLAKVPTQGTDIDPNFVHIMRPEVAQEQKRAINDSLYNIQKQVLTASPLSAEQAQLATAQAALINQFVQRAESVQPDGNISVHTNGVFNDIVLRDNDTVVLPNRTDVVIITGEIVSPGALAWARGASIDTYIDRAGGFSPNSNKKRIVIRHRDGSAEVGDRKTQPGPGDEVVVVPKIGSPWLIIAKDLTQILFQIAVTAGTVIKLNE